MKKIFIYSLLFLTTILWAQEEVATSYTKAENSSKSKKTPIAIGVQGSYLFHMYNNSLYNDFNSDFNNDLNFNNFNHGGVGLNLTIGSAQKFHAVIYCGVSFYQSINIPNGETDILNDPNIGIGGKLTVDFIPINVKLSKKSLSTFYAGLGIGGEYAYNGALYALLNFRVPVGFAFRASKTIEFYIQNAFQFGFEFTDKAYSSSSSSSFSITSDLEFGIKFWIVK